VDFWTEERVSIASKLWEQGISAATIGQAIGASKSAIISKMARVGVRCPPRPKRPVAPPTPPVQRKFVPPKPSPIAKPLSEAARSTAARAAFGPALGFGAEATAALDAHTCRWPIGDPCQPDFRFCNAAPIEPPYCEAHAQIAFVHVGVAR